MKITKNIIIDIQCLKITPLNLNQILTLLKVQFYLDKELLNYSISKNDIEFLVNNRYLIISKEENSSQKYYLREKGKVVLEKIVNIQTKDVGTKLIIKDISQKDIIEDFNNLVNDYRYKFKNLRVGSMGNPDAVKTKLKRWMKTNPEVTRSEILKATTAYIESLNGDYRFLQRADYFIYKQNLRKEEVSRLSLFIEEGRKDVVNSDWTTTLK